MTRTFPPRSSHARRLALALAGVAAAATPVLTQTPETPPPSATVAILNFHNSAIGSNRADYDGLGKGIPDLLNRRLGRNQAIRVVQRERIQEVLAELNLQRTDAVDRETTVRMGKLLGAHHLLTGSFLIDGPKDKPRLTIVLTSTNTETGTVEYSEEASGPGDDVISVLDALGKKVNEGLRFPAMSARPAGRPTGGARGGLSAFRASVLYGQGLGELDKQNYEGAKAFFRQALAQYPDLEEASVRLAALESPGDGTRRP